MPRLSPAALALLAAACAPAIPPPRPLPPPPPPTAVEQAASQLEDTNAVLYTYSPVGKRDPFRDLTASRGTTAVVSADAKNRKLTALQKFDIDQMKLQFTVTGTSSPMAMVTDPTARGHSVHIGDFIGKNWGKVSHIGREEITVTETIADTQTGRVYPVYIPLRMPKSDADKKLDEAVGDGEGRPL